MVVLAVATALTVYGIETLIKPTSANAVSFLVATALTVYGIETIHVFQLKPILLKVATALTVYGIET